jgi:hypothetical protein
MTPDEEIAHLMQASLRAQEYGPRVGRAYARAKIDGGFSANEALEREIRRAEEENAFLLNSAMEFLNH